MELPDPTFADEFNVPQEDAGFVFDVLRAVVSLPFQVHPLTYDHTYSKRLDQPDKVANPARGQLNRENNHFPVLIRA